MRKSMSFAIAVTAIAVTTIAVTTPALALGVGDLAKAVLGNGSILKQGQQTCGSSLSLSLKDTLMMAAAKEAVRKALPATQFSTLESATQADAAKAAQSPGFCNQTVKKKPSLLEKIGNAGKLLAKLKGFGI
jgi:hypothetical protein